MDWLFTIFDIWVKLSYITPALEVLSMVIFITIGIIMYKIKEKKKDKHKD